jgi:hypothetical protein
MRASTKINRDAVEKFFSWEDESPWVLPVGIVIIAAGIILLAYKEVVGILAVVIGGTLIYIGWQRRNVLSEYYEDLKRIKQSDFVSVLKRSFQKTETDIDGLLNFQAQDIDLVNLREVTADQDVVNKLLDKSVFLTGKKSDSKYLKFVLVNKNLNVEYSPIFVSILYLTKTDLIVYFADIDLSRGDLLIEEVNRLFLKDIVEVTISSKSDRIKRGDNKDLFVKYEKATKDRLPDEIVYREHAIRVTKTDGRSFSLPVGAPEYRSGKEGILDSEYEDEDKFARVAREIFKRITDAKARL